MKSASSSHLARCIAHLAFCVVLAAGCSKAANPAAGPKPPIPVGVTPVADQTVPVQIKTFGNVQPHATVSVKAQVNGELKEIGFVEGREVKKGQVLFKIDPAPFDAALKQARANVAQSTAAIQQAEATRTKDVALSANAKLEADRAEKLYKQGAYTQEQRDNAKANQDALGATVAADDSAIAASGAAKAAAEAAVRNAEIMLAYCTITSPLDGVAGNRLVDAGNIVKANDVPMLVLNQVQPIYVGFSIPEQQLPLVKKRLAAEKDAKLPVQAFIPGDDAPPSEGMLSFVDNAIDLTTGTIFLKAEFPNQDQRLWPGQYVNVVLTLVQRPNALVIPAAAVQTGQDGKYVFVVKENKTAEKRPIVTGQTLDDSVVIEQGLKPGENVVTDGQFRLVPGSLVEIVPAKAEEKGEAKPAEKSASKGTGG